ncbi:MAG TPA: MEDS domain-containing protein [Solirubrobacteraceae bacterium]|nr:MEDS domain-containing protein [Solirubrobacteraceae bacterium]
MAVEMRETMVGGGEHVVQFYDQEGDLARVVGDYLSGAVRAGQVAIVIASEPHRQAFEAEMARAGVDTAEVRRNGSVIWLDAADTLSRFVRDGQVDSHGFQKVVGSLVREAAKTGRAIKAYGEMVALLWEAGDVLGAIELEKLWNGLAAESSFSLFCAYHIDSAAGAEHADAVHEVCRLHTAVIDDATARFRAGPNAPFAARRFLAGLLGRRPYGDRVDAHDAQLVVSELATNAVIHAGTPFSVGIRYDGSAVRISVQDWSLTQPIMRDNNPRALSGRGLRLISMVSRAWGIDYGPDGKTVWAELALA